MLESLVSGATVTWLAIGALGVELAVLAWLSRRVAAARLWPFAANLLSGLFLILALRAALVGTGPGAIMLFLGLGFAAHLADLALRLRGGR